MPNVRDLIEAALPGAREFRHDLHRHPELGYEEVRTSARVCERLERHGITYVKGLARGTGVVGFLPATQNAETARTVALRADMDALPIVEETDIPYRSEHPGRMHACGHDGHTTILVTAAEVLSQVERPQNVIFLFQPAEEGGAGAKALIADGALDGSRIGQPVQHVYGLHCSPNEEVGEISTREGAFMAAACQLEITVRGKGAHAAYPHRGIDPILVAAHIVTSLQSVASRTVNPLDSVVVTIGRVTAGVAHNVIPEVAKLDGTLRTLNDETAALAMATVERIARHVAEAHGATAEVKWATDPYPVTVNHREAVSRVREIGAATLGSAKVLETLEPSMGAEDFSFYGRQVPACFFWLGLRAPGQGSYPNLHAPTFDFNDASLPAGVAMMVELGLRG